MNHLIVYAHINPDSFLNRIKNTLQSNWQQAGHTVVIRDLYEMQFQPVLTPQDLVANSQNQLPKDILQEQKWIRQADQITFLYPIWWTGMPAILKGYIDRVFLQGFAYAFKEGELIQPLKGKKVLIINTHGQSEAAYKPHMHNALKLTSDTGIFEFCGMEVIDHQFFAGMSQAQATQLDAYIREVQLLASPLPKVNPN